MDNQQKQNVDAEAEKIRLQKVIDDAKAEKEKLATVMPAEAEKKA